MSTSLSTRTGILSDVGLVLVRAGAMGAASLLIELIWSSPFGLASMIFFANRYLPFIDSALSVNINFNATLSAEECLVQARATACRLYRNVKDCFKDSNPNFHDYIGLMFIVFIIPGIIFTELALNSLQLLAALITIQAYKHLRQTRSPWVTKLYKDGIIFYFSLLVLYLKELGPWLEGPQRVVHSALCNRFLFLIFQGNSATMPGVHLRDAETTTEVILSPNGCYEVILRFGNTMPVSVEISRLVTPREINCFLLVPQKFPRYFELLTNQAISMVVIARILTNVKATLHKYGAPLRSWPSSCSCWCSGEHNSFGSSALTGIVISELILTLRTYAVWERKRSILITLIILTVVFLVPAIVFTELASTVISHGGCRMTSASNIIFLAFCLLTIYESILAILIAIQACKHLRQTRSPWVTKLYKDGERHVYIRDHVLCLSSRTIMREYRLMPVSAGIRAVAPSRNFPSTRATMVSEEQELPVVTLTEILELEDM
ncbi:hypothetical protein F5051DRAFT_425871 [Lentinula edodes]|nr:hypothetical protein F5051DRAFT_425871 [Lentinula edodes]